MLRGPEELQEDMSGRWVGGGEEGRQGGRGVQPSGSVLDASQGLCGGLVFGAWVAWARSCSDGSDCPVVGGAGNAIALGELTTPTAWRKGANVPTGADLRLYLVHDRWPLSTAPTYRVMIPAQDLWVCDLTTAGGPAVGSVLPGCYCPDIHGSAGSQYHARQRTVRVHLLDDLAGLAKVRRRWSPVHGCAGTCSRGIVSAGQCRE